MPRTKVVPVKTNERIKEEAYTRLLRLLAGRQIAIAEHADMSKQLAGIVARPLPFGGLKIGARTESIHDDLADALAFAVWGLPDDLAGPPEHDWPEGTQWAQTPGGIRIPLPVATVRADMSYAGAYGGYWTCSTCRLTVPSSRDVHDRRMRPGRTRATNRRRSPQRPSRPRQSRTMMAATRNLCRSRTTPTRT
jgi:hypothetical protein